MHLIPGNWGGAREEGPDARRGRHGRSGGKTPGRKIAVSSGTCASALCAEPRGLRAAPGALRLWAQRRVRSGRARETLSLRSAALGRAWCSAPGQRLYLSFRPAAVPPYCQSPTPSGGGSGRAVGTDRARGGEMRPGAGERGPLRAPLPLQRARGARGVARPRAEAPWQRG